jgi:hypothetical protein
LSIDIRQGLSNSRRGILLEFQVCLYQLLGRQLLKPLNGFRCELVVVGKVLLGSIKDGLSLLSHLLFFCCFFGGLLSRVLFGSIIIRILLP